MLFRVRDIELSTQRRAEFFLHIHTIKILAHLFECKAIDTVTKLINFSALIIKISGPSAIDQEFLPYRYIQNKSAYTCKRYYYINSCLLAEKYGSRYISDLRSIVKYIQPSSPG